MKVIIILFFAAFIGQATWGQITVFETDFQGGIPSSMQLLDNDMNTPNMAVSEYTAPWICIPDPENLLDSVAASTSWFDPIDTADRWIITPVLNLGAYGNSIIWNAKSQDASFPDDYYILASTTDTDPLSFTDTLGYIQQENFEWTERSVDLSEAGYNDQNIYIAFVLRTYDGYKLYLDDIQVSKEDDASIQENEIGDVVLYPNPCKDVVNFQSDFSIDYISVHDLSGKTLMESREPILKVGFLQKGSYIVKIYSGGYYVSKTLYKW